jgi:hypothetical protein
MVMVLESNGYGVREYDYGFNVRDIIPTKIQNLVQIDKIEKIVEKNDQILDVSRVIVMVITVAST